MASKHTEKTDWTVKPVVKARTVYKDCPTCRGRRQEECKTCEVRARQAAEPDTWYHKPKTLQHAKTAAAIRWDNSPGQKQHGFWTHFEKVYHDRTPVQKHCMALIWCINWGVNVDRLSVPVVPVSAPVVKRRKAGAR